MKGKTNMDARFLFVRKRNLGAALMIVLLAATVAHAQLTPTADAYTNTADPTTNYGAQKLLDVESASQTTYIQFNLSSIPSGYTGADVTKATLKLYVNAVTKAGSFNVDYVNGTWSEGTIDANTAPALGSTIAASVPLTTADKNQYILIDITAAVQAWLNGSQANDGIALVGNSPLNASFDSKESTTTSHPAELDIVFASGNGTITGVNTAAGSGLTGGGTSGTLNLSLLTTCSSGQILSWSGSAWACTTVKGTGTVTSVGSGLGLTGGPITTSGTLSIDTTAVPLLASYNKFTIGQEINTSGNSDGLNAFASGTNYNGVFGLSSATSGTSAGVLGISDSNTGYGVYGASGATGGTGVYGTSSGGFAVYGNASGGGDGVVGVSTAGGTGVSGTAPAGGIGVYGENPSTSVGGDGILGRAHTSNGNGVHGTNDVSLAVGVYGENSATNGYGVYGHAPNGYGMATDSHTTQSRTMGGWVKAMVYVDPFKGGIQRCFNSQLPGSQATLTPCGMTYTYKTVGDYVIDFGFEVDDRFLAATSPYRVFVSGGLDDYYIVTPTQVAVFAFSGTAYVDAPFFLTIF